MMHNIRWDIVSLATQVLLGPLVVLWLTQKLKQYLDLNAWIWIIGGVVAGLVFWMFLKQLQKRL